MSCSERSFDSYLKKIEMRDNSRHNLDFQIFLFCLFFLCNNVKIRFIRELFFFTREIVCQLAYECNIRQNPNYLKNFYYRR